MCVLSKIKKIRVIFTHLKLWVAVARHNFKWFKIWIILFSELKSYIISMLISEYWFII